LAGDPRRGQAGLWQAGNKGRAIAPGLFSFTNPRRAATAVSVRQPRFPSVSPLRKRSGPPHGMKKQRIGEQSQTCRRRRHYFVGQSRRAALSDLKET
jgi:hypothetical protein